MQLSMLQDGPRRDRLFFVQLALNAAWSPVFFAMHQVFGALIIILMVPVT